MEEISTWFFTLRSFKKNLVADHYEGDFDMNFLFIAPQILIAEHYEILTGFSTWRQLKTSLNSAME